MALRKLSHTIFICGVAVLGLELSAFAGEDQETHWLDNVSGNVAVDAFYMVDFNLPDDPSATAAVPHRAFDFTNGFGLAFGILDLAYEGETFGATINLRFGEGANRLLTGAGGDPVFQTLKQAYLTWKPLDKLTFDFGQFDTIYGAEVADSWANLNYTRGALYYLMQPFYHTGLRVGVELSDVVGLTLLAVNGTNLNIDDNQSPHLGAQLSLSLGKFSGYFGYYTGAASSGFGLANGASSADDSDSNFEHFFDVVINAELGSISLVGNFDLYVSAPDAVGFDGSEGSLVYYGASLAAGYSFSDEFGVALRGELLRDPQQFFGTGYDTLVTGTFTLDYKPIPHVIIRLDNRIEWADEEIFVHGDSFATTEETNLSDIWFASTLGLVVTASP